MEAVELEVQPDGKGRLCAIWRTFVADCKEACTPPKYEDIEHYYCERSLFVLPKSSWIRRYLILVTHTRLFEIVVLLAIAVNCILLALDSNAPGFRSSPRGRQLQIADYVFTGFFTVEALLKILAMGFVAKPNTYLRSGWNVLDLAIIGVGYISLAGFANVTALRALRALRPLRTIRRIKEMRVVITSMITSLPGLADVAILMAFYFAIFGTMFVLLFGGQLLGRCADPDFSSAFTDELGFVQGVHYIVDDEDKEDVCSQPRTEAVSWRNETGRLVALGLQSSNGWANDCDPTPSDDHPHGQFCTPFKNPEADDFPDNVPGYNSFDNILLAWIVVFQHVTMTDWSFVMYNVQDGVNWWTFILHFFVCIMGGMIIINLIVAVIYLNFQRTLAGRVSEDLDPEELLGLQPPPSDLTTSSEPFPGLPAKGDGAWLACGKPLGCAGGMGGAAGTLPAGTTAVVGADGVLTLQGGGGLHTAKGPVAEGALERDGSQACGSLEAVGSGRTAASASETFAAGLPPLELAQQPQLNGSSRGMARLNSSTISTSKRYQHADSLTASTAGASKRYQHADSLTASTAGASKRYQHADSLALSDGRGSSMFGGWGAKGGLPAFPQDLDLEGCGASIAKSPTQDQLQFRGSLPPTPADPVTPYAKQQKRQLAPGNPERPARCPGLLSAWLRTRSMCLRLISNPNFELANALIIAVNAIVLGLNWYLMPARLERAMNIINYAFTCYFVLEIIVRLAGRGLEGFFFAPEFRRLNWFDFVITLASFAEMVVQLAPGPQEARFNGGLTAIRLLRLFRLARYWDGLNQILTILGHALSSGIYLLMLVLLFMFIMGLLGMQLFGYKSVWCGEIEDATQRCPPGESCPDIRECYVDCEPSMLGQWFEVDESPYNEMAYCERFPRNYDPSNLGNDPSWPVYWAQVGKPEQLDAHFNNMLNAFITVFIIVTCDNWTDIMFPMMSAITPWVAVYFVVVIVLGAFLLLQLFLAILLSSLDMIQAQQQRKKEQGVRNQMSLSVMLGDKLSKLGLSRVATVGRLSSLMRGALTPQQPSVDKGRPPAQQPAPTAASSPAAPVPKVAIVPATQCVSQPPTQHNLKAMEQLTAGAEPGGKEAKTPSFKRSSNKVSPSNSTCAANDIHHEDAGLPPSVFATSQDAQLDGSCNPRAGPDRQKRGVVEEKEEEACISEDLVMASLDGEESVPMLLLSGRGSQGMQQAEGEDGGGVAPAGAKRPNQVRHAQGGGSTAWVEQDGLEPVFTPHNTVVNALARARLHEKQSHGLDPLDAGAEQGDGDRASSSLQGTSMCCFGPDNRFRIFAAKVVAHTTCAYFVNAMVVLSCVILMLDVVSLDRKSRKAIVLRNLDAATTAVFGLEVLLKCVRLGVLFNGPQSYLRNGWNWWDVFVVAISVVVLSIDASRVETFTWLRALRALRGLRILHAATQIEGINIVMKALGKLVPALVNVIWVGLMFYYIFAVLAVALLSGRMHYCAEDDGDYIDPYYVLPKGETISKAWCETSDSKREGFRMINTSHYHSQIGVELPPYELTTSWTRDLRRFDNVVSGMWVLYQMASIELWSEIMFRAQDAVGRETQPIRSANEHIGLFFVLFMFVGSLTVLNLIVGFSINKFHEMREESRGQSPLLTEEQQNWLSVQNLIAATSVEEITLPSDNKFRRLVHKLVYNKVTDNFMIFVIMANMIVMFCAHYNMSDKFEQAINLTNLIVTAIFFAEMVAKLIAIGVRTYCKNGWNVFDGVITLLSIVSVLIANLSGSNVAFLPVLRILRVVRIFRLIPKAKGLRKMLRTLYFSIPAVSNVAFVLLVFMYLWAIVGMNLFGNIKFTEQEAGVNRHANFRHFPVTMITEFRMLSGEDWNDVMQDCMQLEDCYKVLRDVTVDYVDREGEPQQVDLEEGQYLDPRDDEDIIRALPRDAWRDECSIDPMLAVLYFCIFMLVNSYIMIQLVIGIVLDGIQMQAFLDEMDVGQDDIQSFVDAWLELDPHGTSYLDVKLLTSLLDKVPPPLGVKDLPQASSTVQDIIMSVDIPLRDNLTVHFMEVLHALTGRVMGAELPEQEELNSFRRFVLCLPKGAPHFTAAHAYAAMAVSSAVRGFLQRKVLEEVWDELEEEGLAGPLSFTGKPSGGIGGIMDKSFAVRLGSLDTGTQGRLLSMLHERGLSQSAAWAQLQALREGGGSVPRFETMAELSERLCSNIAHNVDRTG